MVLTVSCPRSFFPSFPVNPSISLQRVRTQLGFRNSLVNFPKSFPIHCAANSNTQNSELARIARPSSTLCSITLTPAASTLPFLEIDMKSGPSHECFLNTHSTFIFVSGASKRKFESVYSGGTMDTPDSGKVFQYWHCCGSEDPFGPGCTAAPHSSCDD